MLGEVGLKLNRKNFYLVYDVCSELDFLKGNTEHLQNQKKSGLQLQEVPNNQLQLQTLILDTL